MDTIEGNRLIAEFMQSDSRPHRYDISFDWLMPVFAKIMYMPCVNACWITENGVRISFSGGVRSEINIPSYPEYELKIEMVWLAVVAFIQWYNTQPKPQS